MWRLSAALAAVLTPGIALADAPTPTPPGVSQPASAPLPDFDATAVQNDAMASGVVISRESNVLAAMTRQLAAMVVQLRAQITELTKQGTERDAKITELTKQLAAVPKPDAPK